MSEDEPEAKNPLVLWLKIMATLISAIALLYGAYYTGYAEQHKQQERINDEIREQETMKLELAKQYMPMLLSKDNAKRIEATVILTYTHPDELMEMLEIVKRISTDIDSKMEVRLEQSQQAVKDIKKDIRWSIVISSDKVLSDAIPEARNAKDKNYSPVRIFERKGWYATTIGEYLTESQAQASLSAIRKDFYRDAFTVNMLNWNPGREIPESEWK